MDPFDTNSYDQFDVTKGSHLKPAEVQDGVRPEASDTEKIVKAIEDLSGLLKTWIEKSDGKPSTPPVAPEIPQKSETRPTPEITQKVTPAPVAPVAPVPVPPAAPTPPLHTPVAPSPPSTPQELRDRNREAQERVSGPHTPITPAPKAIEVSELPIQPSPPAIKVTEAPIQPAPPPPTPPKPPSSPTMPQERPRKDTPFSPFVPLGAPPAPVQPPLRDMPSPPATATTLPVVPQGFEDGMAAVLDRLKAQKREPLPDPTQPDPQPAPPDRTPQDAKPIGRGEKQSEERRGVVRDEQGQMKQPDTQPAPSTNTALNDLIGLLKDKVKDEGKAPIMDRKDQERYNPPNETAKSGEPVKPGVPTPTPQGDKGDNKELVNLLKSILDESKKQSGLFVVLVDAVKAIDTNPSFGGS